jgi:hypothetical protein
VTRVRWLSFGGAGVLLLALVSSVFLVGPGVGAQAGRDL